MTVSLKLKVEEKEHLYYRKYRYKASCKVVGSFYTSYETTIEGYIKRVEDCRGMYNRVPAHLVASTDDNHLDDIKKLIAFKNKFKNTEGTIRQESNTSNFYSNDLNVLKELNKLFTNVKYSEVNVLPDGIIYFKRDIPANYRVYFKGIRINRDIKIDITDYLTKNEKTAKPSKSLASWLTPTKYNWQYAWASNTFFIDYDEPTQLTMMHLLFGEILGKNYKLEKKA